MLIWFVAAYLGAIICTNFQISAVDTVEATSTVPLNKTSISLNLHILISIFKMDPRATEAAMKQMQNMSPSQVS